MGHSLKMAKEKKLFVASLLVKQGKMLNTTIINLTKTKFGSGITGSDIAMVRKLVKDQNDVKGKTAYECMSKMLRSGEGNRKIIDRLRPTYGKIVNNNILAELRQELNLPTSRRNGKNGDTTHTGDDPIGHIFSYMHSNKISSMMLNADGRVIETREEQHEYKVG